MATRKQTIDISHPVQPQQQRGAAVPVGKQNIATGAQRKARQALGDIGNLVDGKVQTQINRPITRRFGAQLLAQATAADAKKKHVTVPVNGMVAKGVSKMEKKVTTIPVNGAVAKGCAKAEKKVIIKKKVEKAIEISTESEEQVKKESANIPSSSISSRKKVHTLTSVLTARSKAACGITDKQKELAHDIDTADAEDQLAVVDYIEDIYKFYKLAEHSSRPHDYMDSQIEINARMRAILADWLIDVHHKFELMPETLYLALHIIDRYLSMEMVARRELQLVGVSAMLIASKYEEIWAPQVNDFVCISDRAYSGEQILVMEKKILNKLEWNLTVPTPYVFLVRFLKAARSDKEMEHMVFFFAELGLMQYSLIMYCPSMVAASAVYAARCTLKMSPLWTETLKCHTGFSEDQLLDCAEILVNSHSAAPESKLKVVFKKYSSELFGSVALRPPATKVLQDLKASREVNAA